MSGIGNNSICRDLEFSDNFKREGENWKGWAMEKGLLGTEWMLIVRVKSKGKEEQKGLMSDIPKQHQLRAFG